MPADLSWVLVTFMCSVSGCSPLPDIGPMSFELCQNVRPGFIRSMQERGANWVEAECHYRASN